MVKEFILTVAVLIYGSDGSNGQRDPQTLHFTDKQTCIEVKNVLNGHNWRNPFPVPETGKYYITRWQVTDDCAELAVLPPPPKPAPPPVAEPAPEVVPDDATTAPPVPEKH